MVQKSFKSGWHYWRLEHSDNPSVKWVPLWFSEGYERRERDGLQLAYNVPKIRGGGAISPLPLLPLCNGGLLGRAMMLSNFQFRAVLVTLIIEREGS